MRTGISVRFGSVLLEQCRNGLILLYCTMQITFISAQCGPFDFWDLLLNLLFLS